MSSEQKVENNEQDAGAGATSDEALKDKQNDDTESVSDDAQPAEMDSAQQNDALDELRAKLEEAEQKASANWDAVLREKAQSDNAKKRAERDVSNARKFALEKICSDLLPILDSMEQGLALSATTDETKAVLTGMDMTMKMMVEALAKHGVEQIDPHGEVFNPEHHEAVAMQESADHAPNTVMSVFQKGYILNGRLVRAARVVVAKGESPNIDTEA